MTFMAIWFSLITLLIAVIVWVKNYQVFNIRMEILRWVSKAANEEIWSESPTKVHHRWKEFYEWFNHEVHHYDRMWVDPRIWSAKRYRKSFEEFREKVRNEEPTRYTVTR